MFKATVRLLIMSAIVSAVGITLLLKVIPMVLGLVGGSLMATGYLILVQYVPTLILVFLWLKKRQNSSD